MTHVEVEVSEWHDPYLEPPPLDIELLVELNGCKLARYINYQFRESEGVGHVKRWAHIKKHEKP